MASPGGYAAQRVAVIEKQLERQRAALAATQQEITRLESALHRWKAGHEGELRTGAVLDALGVEGWSVLHDVHWPGRPKANLDHVAVGPGGVVVVDAKRWAGAVTTSGGVLKQGGWRRTRECESAAHTAADVASLLGPEHRSAVSSVLCLSGQQLAPAPVEGGVVAVGDAHLADHLRSLPRRLDDDDVRALHAELRGLLAGATSPAVLSAGAWASRTAPDPTTTPTPTRRSLRSVAHGDRRVRRRPALSRTGYLVTRVGLLAALVVGSSAAVRALG